MSAAEVEAAPLECLGVAPGEPPDYDLMCNLSLEGSPRGCLSPWGMSGGGGLLPGRLSGMGGRTARGSSEMSGRSK